MSKIGWLWLLGSASLWAADYRDPFLPPVVASCVVRSASLAGWLLKGVIGTADLRHGWVVTPQGQWLQLQPRQLLPDGDWRVMRITPWQLTLEEDKLEEDKADNICSGRTEPVVLSLGQTGSQVQRRAE